MGGEGARREEREEKIELCFRDSLFLARKKAQTRVACNLAQQRRAVERRRVQQRNGDFLRPSSPTPKWENRGKETLFAPFDDRPTSFSHAHRTHCTSAKAKSSPDHICIEWMDGGCGKNERKGPKMPNGGDRNKGIGFAGCDITKFLSKMTRKS